MTLNRFQSFARRVADSLDGENRVPFAGPLDKSARVGQQSATSAEDLNDRMAVLQKAASVFRRRVGARRDIRETYCSKSG